jgi:2-amino-4-hydroxy-6-hydroxymethyldihydropteridine diphosphokinase/dihydropteroate synthase
MIILGLGSNLGDSLNHLRAGLKLIKQIRETTLLNVSPIYISDALLPENAPLDWNTPYLNLAVSLKTRLPPLGLLKELKKIEEKIGRRPTVRHWGPRVLDIDILAFDDLIIQSEVLTVPRENLQERPFALWPLADIHPFWVFPLEGPNLGRTAAHMVEVWGSRFSGSAPYHTQQINQRIDTAQLVGILNVTPDSFSDGGHFLDEEKALGHVQAMIEAGAEIIDIGAESTAPRASAVTSATEWLRLKKILVAIKDNEKNFLIRPKLSIDTYHPETASHALDVGIDWINDVSGLDDRKMRALIKSAHVDCVVMHHLSIPERRGNVLPRDEDPVKLVYEWGKVRIDELEKQGISRDKIIFDPGIGFGKAAEQSLILLSNLEVFKKLDVRILVGHSRKTFFSLLSQKTFVERDLETMVSSIYLSNHGADYLRVHDVSSSARGLKTMCALKSLASK